MVIMFCFLADHTLLDKVFNIGFETFLGEELTDTVICGLGTRVPPIAVACSALMSLVCKAELLATQIL
jgi:hypothetical protein